MIEIFQILTFRTINIALYHPGGGGTLNVEVVDMLVRNFFGKS